MAFVGFQAIFAIITVALISGAIADRAKFGAWMVFAGIWVTLVYFPVAHWVFDFNRMPTARSAAGSASGLGVIDFAGGTAVHINAGAAALALALVLGKRVGFGKDPAMRPHNVPFVMLGAGLLWFGWFGFNAGSALARQRRRRLRLDQHPRRPGRRHPRLADRGEAPRRHATSLGAASGAVAGLVAITPACSASDPAAARSCLGLVAGAVCALAVGLKYKLGFDDSLDVVGVHLVGGLIGHPLHRPLRAPGTAGGASTGCSTAAASTSWASRRSAPSRSCLLVRDRLRHRLDHPEDHGLPGHRRGRGRRASTSSCTPRPPTTSPRSVAAPAAVHHWSAQAHAEARNTGRRSGA